MEQIEEVCPVCGISANQIQSHLQQHSKDDLIKAYSCKSGTAAPISNTTPLNVVASTSSNDMTTAMQQANVQTLTSATNAYNTILIPVNASNCGIQALSQPAFSFAMQAKPPFGNMQIPNLMPVQNPLICMPQNPYPSFINPNVPPFPAQVKDASSQVNLASQTVNTVSQSAAEDITKKVIPQQNYVQNAGFPNVQQSPFQAMQVYPFYSPSIASNPGVPNYSFYGNNLYASPAVVQFPGFNAPGCYSGVQPSPGSFKHVNQQLFTGSMQPNESIKVEQLFPDKQGSPQEKQCYYVGERDALVSIGDDVKLILPKDILSKEEVLGEFLREQLATAIASEVKSEYAENETLSRNVDQNNQLLNSSEVGCAPSIENLLSPNKRSRIAEKLLKIEDTDTSICSITLEDHNKNKIHCIDIDADTDNMTKNVGNNKANFTVNNEEDCLEVFEGDHILGTVEEIFSVEGNQLKHCSIVESAYFEDSQEVRKPKVIKMFSRNVHYSKFDEEFDSERSIKCVSQSSDDVLKDENSGTLASQDLGVVDVTDHKVESYKVENFDSASVPEEKLSLKSSETLEHSDSESPCPMESTIQDLICSDEPGLHSMSPRKKMCSSEFRISNSEESTHINFGLDKASSLSLSSTFMPGFLNQVKASCDTDIEAIIFKDEKIIQTSSIDTEFFLEPFASTSGVQSKTTLLNKSVDHEEYDFDYESDYFDSDSELYQNNKHGILFQWKCSKCQKSFKSLKEKLLHSGCHMDETKKEFTEESSPVKLEIEEMNSLEESIGADSKVDITKGDDVIKHRIKLLRNPLACSICFAQFSDQLSTNQHMKTHSIAELKCSICSKQIKSFYQWTDHQLFHYGASKHECKYCGKKFEKSALLNIHVRKHTGQRPFKCVTCNKKFAVRGTLKAHMLTHLKSEEADCDFCSKTFKNFTCMIRHKVKYHLQKKQIIFKKKLDYLCSTCNAVFQTERKLLWHQETHKRWPSKCKFCGDSFVHQSGLTKHIRLKHNSKHVPEGEKKGVSVSCAVCGKMYTSSSIALHMRTHNGYKPFKCLLCARQFSVKCNLDNHMWVHARTRDRPYKCNSCDKSYSRKKFLEAHLRSHKKLKPYTCNECGKAFAYKNNLNSHIKYHFGEKQHLCSYCGKAFFRKYNLKDHVRIHTGETPFSCTICNKEFTQKSNYNVHIKAFHVERHVLDEEV